MDEMGFKPYGEQLFIWTAIDIDSREVLAVNAIWQTFMNMEHVPNKSLRSMHKQAARVC